MARSRVDKLLQKSVALPNAGNTVNTNSIDLETTAAYPTSDEFHVAIVTTSGVGANDKNITAVLQSSNEAAANFTNVANVATVVINEASSVYPATTRIIALPPTFAQRYLRAQATGEANGGDASNGTLTIELRL